MSAIKRVKENLAQINRDDVEKIGREFIANKILAARIVPARLRVMGLRRLGVLIGRSYIGSGLRLENFNVIIGHGVTIRRNVIMRGSAQIRIDDNADIGDRATLDTDTNIGDVSSFSFPIVVPHGKEIAQGALLTGNNVG